MTTVNNFDVVKEMAERNSQHFHGYSINNVENVNAGKNGWGSIKIAISSADAQQILNDLLGKKKMNRNLMLLTWSTDEFDEIKKELEGKKKESPGWVLLNEKLPEEGQRIYAIRKDMSSITLWNYSNALKDLFVRDFLAWIPAEELLPDVNKLLESINRTASTLLERLKKSHHEDNKNDD